MAKIPAGEGLGNVVASPHRFSDAAVPPGAYGERIGQALQGVADVLAVEEREARMRREAADEATARGALGAARDDLTSAADEMAEGIRTGQIDKTKAAEEWQARAKERIESALPGVPQAHRAVVQQDLDRRVAALSRGVGKAVTLRDQQDVRSGIDQTLEYAERLYLTDPTAANQLATETIAELGPHGGLDPASLSKMKQSWTERTRFTKGFSMVNGARRSNADLDNVEKQLGSEEFAGMDPQRKAQLLTTIEGYKVANVQKAEAEARRRQAEQERKLRFAESQFNAANSLFQSGKMLSHEYSAQVSKDVIGTPYELAFKELLKQAPAKSAFGMQPLAVMDQAISQARAQLNVSGTNPQAEKTLSQLEHIRDQARRDYAEDPLLAAQERGIVQAVAPINVENMQSLLGTIGKRVDQASLVAQQVGQPVSPLLKAESEQVSRILNMLPVDQRSTAIAQLAKTVGPQQAAAIGRQMAPKDKALGIALGMAGDKTTQGRYTSELVLRGAQALKDKGVKAEGGALDSPTPGVRALVAKEIGDAFTNDEVREAMIDAAMYVEYGLRAEGHGGVQQAVNLATGGIVERNGKKVPLPYGMKESEFDKRLSTLTPSAIVGIRPLSTSPAGLIEKGNIDLGKRPIVTNKDGSISTVRSIGVNIDGSEVLIPTVSDAGKVMTDEQAIDAFMRTRRHLGKFKTPEQEAALVFVSGTPMPLNDFLAQIKDAQLLQAGRGRYAVQTGNGIATNAQGRPIIIEVK